jgi:hypothetical protein
MSTNNARIRRRCDCGKEATVAKSSYFICAKCADIESRAHGFGRGARTGSNQKKWRWNQVCETFSCALGMHNGRTPRMMGHD